MELPPGSGDPCQLGMEKARHPGTHLMLSAQKTPYPRRVQNPTHKHLSFALFAAVKKKKQNCDMVANMNKERKTKISPQILTVWLVSKTN